MSSYQSLAASYDGLMADAAYQKRADYLVRCFTRSVRPVRTVLDLACGTGTIACLLAARGYDVVATDASEEMLTRAAQKAEGLEHPPLLVRQSMPCLRLGREVDAVVCTIDSLNYLTREKDLRETFRRVHRWLGEGGVFVFDVNTPAKFRAMDGQMYADETEGSYCVWRTFFSERTKICTYQVDLFRLRPDGAWEREFEEHRQRAWSEAELRTFLADAGFTDVKRTGDLSRRAPKEDEVRWVFHCKK